MNRRTELAIYAVSALLLAGTAAVWWQGVRPAPMAVLQPVGVVEKAGGSQEDPPKAPDASDASDAPAATIFVHIAGAVQKPGVYELPEGERLFAALELVGLRDDADTSALNLASVLRDSQKVYVPAVGEVPPPGGGGGGAGGSGGGSPSSWDGGTGGQSTGSSAVQFPININTATQAELELLPGIGPVLAGAIIARREEVGPFRRIEDLQDVSGIGAKTFERLAPLVTTD
ncbi:MAG: helix-hairpin-helix domain-containing protein [Bacillota bacterium]